MKTLLLVFVGGGIGSCLRYALSVWLNPISAFLPLGTLLSNAVACVVLGFFAYLVQSKIIENEQVKFFVMVGICGGFSTFSTFSNELFAYFQNEKYFSFATYALISLFLCYLGIFLGMFLARIIS
jgi:fluoride exporter